MIRIASTGTASTGKSAVLNALFGTNFRVDARARSTASAVKAILRYGDSEIEVIDLPPLSSRSEGLNADVYLLICDKDLTEPEYQEAVRICRAGRALGVVLNKVDTYSARHLAELLEHIRARLQGHVDASRVVSCAAEPVRIVHEQRPDGSTVEQFVPGAPDVRELELLVNALINEAENTLRVRARELATRTSNRLSTFLRERIR